MGGGEPVATDSKTVAGVSSTMGSNPILSDAVLGNGLPNGPLALADIKAWYQQRTSLLCREEC